jgi:hypothetical protein
MADKMAPKKPSVGPMTLHRQGFCAEPHCQQIGSTKNPINFFNLLQLRGQKQIPGKFFPSWEALRSPGETRNMDFPVCIPICFQCGNTDNPCRCKVVGPTLGFVVAALSAILFYPAGLVTYACDRKQSRALFSAPAQIQGKMSSGIPF